MFKKCLKIDEKGVKVKKKMCKTRYNGAKHLK